jgi:hypothetical protein
MTMQRLCHATTAVLMGTILLCRPAAPLHADPTMHDYPPQARVEYVNECIAKNGGKLSSLYQCSCVIDQIAKRLTYDDFVEAGTYAHYSTLPGERSGLFRDSDKAQELAKLFRETETGAYRQCGLAQK